LVILSIGERYLFDYTEGVRFLVTVMIANEQQSSHTADSFTSSIQ